MKNLLQRIVEFVKAEPVRVATWATAAVVFLATKLGVVVNSSDVLDSLLLVIPVLCGGELARAKVSPTDGV